MEKRERTGARIDESVLSGVEIVPLGEIPRARLERIAAGVHDVTAPPDVIRTLAREPMTESAVTQFAADWAQFQAAQS